MGEPVIDDFLETIGPRWTQTCIGPGSLAVENSVLRLSIPSVQSGHYADAQLDDYGSLVRSSFPWRPPLRMEVRARSSLPTATSDQNGAFLRGTAGFGLWNYPFSVRGDVLMLPEAIWFFYASPPSNMALVPHIPGWGWKAQVVHSMRPEALVATVPLGLTAAWARLTGQTQAAAGWLQRLSGAQEALLPAAMETWHTYVLEWREYAAYFWVG